MKRLVFVLALFALSAAADTLTRTAVLSADRPSAVFAVPNGYDCTAVEGGTAAAPVVMAGVTLIPVRGTNVVTATFTAGTNVWTGVPARLIRERIRSIVVNPDDIEVGAASAAPTRRAAFAASSAATSTLSSAQADMIVLAPPALYADWQAYASMRAAQKGITVEAVNTLDIYTNDTYKIGADGVRNYAESLHKYLRTMQPKKGFSYVLLGGPWINAQSLPTDNWADGTPRSITNSVPGILAHPYGANIASDMFYACLQLKSDQSYPWTYGTEDTYYSDSHQDYCDQSADIVVARVPLKPVDVNGTMYTQKMLFEAYTQKLVRAESGDYKGTGRLGQAWDANNMGCSYGVNNGQTTEYEFYDDAANIFAPDRPCMRYADVEVVQRPIIQGHVKNYRPVVAVDSLNAMCWTKPYGTVDEASSAYFRTDRDYASCDSHGYTDGAGYFNTGNFKNATGITLLNDMSIPCDTGYMQGSGMSMGEMTVMAPNGGAISSVNNNNEGWITDYNNDYSYRLMHGCQRAFLQYGWDAGSAWLQAHLDYVGRTSDGSSPNTNNTFSTYGNNSVPGYVLTEHTLYGDPLVCAAAPTSGKDASVFPTFATNLITAASSISVSGSNAVLSVTLNDSATFAKASGASVARMKVMNGVYVSYGSSVTFDGVEGGVGGTVEFSDTGTITLNAAGRFYLGGTKNVTSVTMGGTGAILNCDNIDSNLASITFDTDEGATNVLRGVNSAALAGRTINVKGGTLCLESENLFDSTTKIVMNGGTIVFGPSPSLGRWLPSNEPLRAAITGTGTIRLPYGKPKSSLVGDIADTITIIEAPSATEAFSFNGFENSDPTGWFTAWKNGYILSDDTLLTPAGFAHQTAKDHNPCYGLVEDYFRTYALYIDLSQLESGERVILCQGSGGSGAYLVGCLMLVRSSSGTIDVVVRHPYAYSSSYGEYYKENRCISLPYPGDGLHLYVLSLRGMYIDLSIDGGDKSSGWNSYNLTTGFQIGAEWAGGRAEANGMAVGMVKGYDCVLSDADIAALCAEYPALPMGSTIRESLSYNGSGTATLPNSTLAAGTTLSIVGGNLEIDYETVANADQLVFDPGEGKAVTLTIMGGMLKASSIDVKSGTLSIVIKNRGSLEIDSWNNSTVGTINVTLNGGRLYVKDGTTPANLTKSTDLGIENIVGADEYVAPEYADERVLSINVALPEAKNGLAAARTLMRAQTIDTQNAIWAVPGSSWNDCYTGDTTDLRAWVCSNRVDLSGTKVTLSANNYWGYLASNSTVPAAFLGGYLDDGGSHAQIKVTGVPYYEYDVIVYAATDTTSAKFSPVQINGKYYIQTSTTDAATEVKNGTNYCWGTALAKSAELSTNALYVPNLKGDLTIVGGANQTIDGQKCRGGIAAVQIRCRTLEKPRPVVDYSQLSINLATAANQFMSSSADHCWCNVLKDSSNAAVDVSTNLVENLDVTLKASNTWGYDTSVSDNFLKGYLDDGGDGASITVDTIPWKVYDVIVYTATDSTNGKFKPFCINGKYYRQNAGTETASEVSSFDGETWGTPLQGTATLGKNALRVNGLTNTVLTVKGGVGDSDNALRGAIAAITIIDATPVVEQTFEGTNFAVNVMYAADQTMTSDEEVTWFNLQPGGGMHTYTLTNEVVATLVCYNTYRYTDNVADNFLKGYLDDGDLNGAAKSAKAYASVTITNVPYACYDVIVYAATDSGNAKFRPYRVNGTYYRQDTTDATATVTTGFDGASWGCSQNATASLGVNALRVNGLTNSVLVVAGGEGDTSVSPALRGGIAAVVVMKAEANPIELIPGKTAEETVAALCTTNAVVITDAARVSASGCTVTIGGTTITLRSYYTAVITNGLLKVELNDIARPTLPAPAVSTDAITLTCPTLEGLVYQLWKGASLTGMAADPEQLKVGDGSPVSFETTPDPAAAAGFYKVEVTDHQ